jgi:hypothetical protein
MMDDIFLKILTNEDAFLTECKTRVGYISTERRIPNGMQSGKNCPSFDLYD